MRRFLLTCAAAAAVEAGVLISGCGSDAYRYGNPAWAAEVCATRGSEVVDYSPHDPYSGRLASVVCADGHVEEK